MEVRKGYKQTEVGVIPNDWEVRAIRELNFDISDGNYSSKYPKSSDFRVMGIPFIRANNILKMKVVDDDMRFISDTQHSELLKGHLKKNDILVTTRGEIGQIAFVPDRHIGSNINAQLVRINTSKLDIDHRFIGYIMAFDNAQKQFEKLQTGSALKQLPVGRLLDLLIPLPPTKAEQTAIATALSDIDTLITSLEKLIAKKRNIKQGVMQELLRPKEGWAGKKLGEVLKIRHGRSQKGIEQENGEFPIVATGGNIGRASQAIYNKPSVLIGRKGTIDKPQFLDKPFWAIDTIFYSEISDLCDAKFIYYRFNLIKWQTHNEASGVPSLNAKTIENIEIHIPETKAEQTRIATILSDMDAEIEALEKKLEKYRRIKQGMMQELLTGRIRLV